MTVTTAVLAALSLAAALGPSTVPAPEWPCQEALKPSLSPSAYWPQASKGEGWREDAQVAAMVQATALRNTPQEEAQTRLRAFVHTRPDARDKLAVGLISTIDDERRAIIAGVQRFNARQAELAARVERDYAAGDAQDGKDSRTTTLEQRSALEEQANWDMRVFEDRQRMLPLVCRQPVALEKRLDALLAAIRRP